MTKDKKTQVSSQVMELKDLISGPLVATIDADAMSTKRYLSYLYELAFEDYNYETGKAGKLRMVEFSYNTQNKKGIQSQKIRVPMLTLVPLPLLQVKEADFDFDIQIVDAVQTNYNIPNSSLQHENENVDERKKQTTGRGPEDFKLRVAMAGHVGKNTSVYSNSSMTANMKVSVKMRQADIPGGLSRILNLTTNNILAEDENEESALNE